MYSQFIYYILVILIISIYPDKKDTIFSFPAALGLFLLSIIGFTALTRMRFEIFSKTIDSSSLTHLDHRFNRIVTQQTILAILLLAFFVHGLNFPEFLFTTTLFSLFPTFIAVILLGIFVGLMAVIWAYSYKIYCNIYHNDLTFSSYAKSNIAFALPVILPWLVLSVFSDLFTAMPKSNFLHNFFLSGPGELLFYLFFIGLVLLTGPGIIQKLWGCKPLEFGNERLHIETLCRRAGLEFTDIVYWPIYGGKMITAGIMGFIKTSRYIFITPALLRMLRLDEIDSVIAHEIGHVKKKHMFFYILLLSGYLFFIYAFLQIGLFILIFSGYTPETILSLQSEPSFFSATVHILFLAGSFILYFRFVFGFFIRNFERQADAYVFELFDSAKPLIRTFEKISLTSGLPPDKPSWHHFSIKNRISFLHQCEADKSVISAHNRKVKISLWVFVLVLLFMGTMEYGVTQSKISRNLLNHAVEKQILDEIQKDPENPELYAVLGDLYLELEAYEKAVSAYKTSLSFNANHSRVLNNLAWLYATCPDRDIRNPSKALALAQKAVSMSPTPEILDTLAESLYINGKIEEAVLSQKKAITLGRKNPAVYQNQMDHYESQLKKFKQAVDE